MIAVCSDKGSPGVTTLATALGLVWPGERLLLEADPSGADLPLRLRPGPGPDEGLDYLAPQPTVLHLAMDAQSRPPDGNSVLSHYAQPTSLGVPVIAGVLLAEAWTPMRAMWGPLTAQARAWPGTLIVDLGRLQPGHPGVELARAADVVLVLTRVSVADPRVSLADTFHARGRVKALAELLQRPAPAPPAVGVVVRAGRSRGDPMREIGQMVAAIRAEIPVVGGVADDPAGAALLWRERPSSSDLQRSPLIRSVTDLRARIQRTWSLPTAPAPQATSSPAPAEKRRRIRTRMNGEGP
jgi:hypothetical protein